jgi:hypothetical protein
MMRMRDSFHTASPPADFARDLGGPFEIEAQHADHGAREENILSEDGRKALGLEQFDENEDGLSEGQKRVREMANRSMKGEAAV